MSFWSEKGSIAEQCWKNGHPDFPVYDMHGHMGGHYAIYFNRCEPAAVVEHMKRAGVKHLVFSHHYALWEPTFRNERVYEMCREFPEHLRFYVAINPHFPDNIKEDLANFDKWKPWTFGLKLLPDYHGTPVTSPAFQYALDFAEERGLPVLIHTWGGSRCDGGDVIYESVQKYSRIKFLLGHSIYGDWENARRCVQESAGNVYLELTSIPGELNTLEMLTELVGSEKLIFGTDMPWFDEYQAVGGVLAADITEDDKRNILYRNVEQIFGKDW